MVLRFFSVFSLYFLHLLKLMLVTKWELMLSLGKPSVLGLGSEEERGEEEEPLAFSGLWSGWGLLQGTLYKGRIQPCPYLIFSLSLR